MIIVDSKAFNRAKEASPEADYFIYFRPDYIVACYGYENDVNPVILKMDKYYLDRYGLVSVLMDRNGKVIYRNDHE